MSTFHGGFYVRRVDRAVIPLVRRAMRDYLFRTVKNAHELHIAVIARRGAPVLHFAVRGEIENGASADGKGYAIFHATHARLGADIARAAKADVFAYHYENQSGSEGVTTFDSAGAQIADAQASWDECADSAALPLSRLAVQLGVDRGALDSLIPYDTPSFKMPLVGDVPLDALDDYLKRAPRLAPSDPPDWQAMTLYFPGSWLREIEDLAERRGTSESAILLEAWQMTKSDPALAPPQAPPDATKVGARVALPELAWDEMRTLAKDMDRSLSWLLQRAYRAARSRLLA